MTSRKTISVFAGVVFSSLVAISGCKSNVEPTAQTGSEFKTLDNFAAGTTKRINECRGSSQVIVPESRIVLNSQIFDGPNGAAKASEYKGYVKEYLSSVPVDLQRAFNALNGEILITDKAESLCGKSFSDASSSQYVAAERRVVESCFLYTTSADRKKSYFTVVHKPDVRAIRHGGIRVFGSIYAQFIPRMVPNPVKSGPKFALVETESLEFSNYKSRISEKFLADIAKQGIYDLDNLKPLLGENIKATVQANTKAGKSALQDLIIKYGSESPVSDAAKINLIRKRFDDFVFAEAFDSFRCSDKTVAVMKSEFPGTYAEYVALDQNILAVAKSVANQLEGSDTALALTESENTKAVPQMQLQGSGGDLLSILAPILGQLAGGSSASRPVTTDPNGGAIQQQQPSGTDVAQILSAVPFNDLAKMFQDMGQTCASCGCQGGSCQCDGGCCGGCSCSSGGGCSCCSGGCSCCGMAS